MQYCFTNRFGGVSVAPYESYNFGLHVGDEPAHVYQNRETLKASLGVSKIVFMNQVHGDKIVCIHSGDETPTCDAMITQQRGIALCVMVADCIPILLYDEKSQSIGVAHAGREGSLLHVGQKTAQVMCEHFGAELQSLRIWMGPSIHACCYEVKNDVTQGFEKTLHVREERYFLDLQTYNKEAFLGMGIKEEQLEISPVCTCCDAHYFSYRREKQTGRFVGVICL